MPAFLTAWFKAPKCARMRFFWQSLAETHRCSRQSAFHSAPQPALVRAGVGGSHRRPQAAAKPSVLKGCKVAAAFLRQSVTVPLKD